MPRYAVHLEVRTTRPLTQAQLDRIDDTGRHALLVTGRPRASTLEVSLEMDGGDVAGALVRSLNLVLDQVPGEVRRAKLSQLRDPSSPTRRRRRR